MGGILSGGDHKSNVLYITKYIAKQNVVGSAAAGVPNNADVALDGAGGALGCVFLLFLALTYVSKEEKFCESLNAWLSSVG